MFKVKFCVIISVALFLTQHGRAAEGKEIHKPYAPDGIPFVIADTPWTSDMQGNHRAVVSIETADLKSVLAVLPWRRPDLRPETKGIIVKNAQSGETVRNVKILKLTSEEGRIVFEPTGTGSEYYIYYLPAEFKKGYADARYGKPWNQYILQEDIADKQWMATLPCNEHNYEKAKVLRFESRTEFDFFTVMGTIATEKETLLLQDKYPENPVIFQEDREYSIRLFDKIPVRWVQTGLKTDFSGNAMRNEYYVWQMGIWTPRKEANDIHLSFSDFTDLKTGSIISKDSVTCFNLQGTNWDGTPLSFKVNVPQGRIQPLWCGIQIPEDAIPGTYVGKAMLSAEGMRAREMNVSITVSDRILEDKGDGDLWRMARLRWLNSTIGMDNHPVAPFEAMHVKGKVITATDKILTVGSNGLPVSIAINEQQILSKPLEFMVVTDRGERSFKSGHINIVQDAEGLVSWQAKSLQDGISFVCKAGMEYDGCINYQIKISSDKTMEIKDIRLTADYSPYVSEYFMGVGHKGGYRPKTYSWSWKGPYDSYWIGNTLAGLHVEYRGSTYHGPLLNDYKPEAPQVWSNGGKGSISVSDNMDSSAHVLTSTGSTSLDAKGKTFEFVLMMTPAKPVDPKKYFSDRYTQCSTCMDEAAVNGANIQNLHHATELNPVINYPFIVQQPLIRYIQKQHQYGRKVKIYYTIRELSSYCAEIYALRSLGHEIFTGGVGYGIPWLCEHLIDDYKPAWYTELPNETADAALVLSGFSRWINYYLEGLRWMLQNYRIDGIYMDDVSFDRPVLKRIRKIMETYRPGALIDLHSNTQYSIGPANQYAGFFPYINRLWFGEGFKYNDMMPDEWFVTFSGIPFGLMSEMMIEDINPYLGMVYGATGRYGYGRESDPSPVWALWKSFGIADAEMKGYWSGDCPVKTSHPNVKATVYRKPDKILISLGNFDTQNQSVKLTFDWKALGFSPEKVTVTAPEIKDFQSAATFGINELIPIGAKKGWLLVLKEKKGR